MTSKLGKSLAIGDTYRNYKGDPKITHQNDRTSGEPTGNHCNQLRNQMITNCKRNCMSTVSFDGKFPGMKKPQDFIVYPMQDSGEIITIQSGHRFGTIDLSTGNGIVSTNKSQYANRIWLAACRAMRIAVEIQLCAEDLQTLRGWIKSTGGTEVGTCVISDNTGVMAL